MSTQFEKRLCLSTCICQSTSLLCCMSFLYLSVSVYIPAYRTLNSGFSEDSVICSTVSNITLHYCEDEVRNPSWTSCGHGCMSFPEGNCTQIRVDVRRNGSGIRLEECDPAAFHTRYCSGYDPKLKALFECSHGECASMHGLSEERCTDINTNQKDILIREGDIIHTTKCARARDIETEIEIWPRNFRSINHPNRPPMMMLFCTTLGNVADDITSYTLSDCLNGTLVEPDHFGNATNITHVLTSHYESMERLVDVERRFVPPEEDLLIYNATPLYINPDGCVDTSEQECEKFYEEYGRDGKNVPVRSQSRFQCYYTPHHSNFVVFRFSRNETKRMVMIYALVPIALAVVSYMTCFLRTIMICGSGNSRGQSS